MAYDTKIEIDIFETVYSGSSSYFRTGKPSFDTGWGRCAACKAWIDVLKQNNPVIEFNAIGARYHKKEFCDWAPGSIRRIRLKPRGTGGKHKKKHNENVFRY